MNRQRLMILGIITLALLVWGIDLYQHPITWSGMVLRKQLIYLSGLMAFLFMGLILVLSIRPRCLERWFGGLDQMYALHKWAGIFAIGFAVFHYLIKLGKPVFAYLFGAGAGKGPKPELFGFEAWLKSFSGIAKDLGEYLVYFLMVMLVITLWQKFSYKIWRHLHRLMAPVFIILAFHSLVLMPFSYWTQPVGVVIILVSIIGSVAAVWAMLGKIGAGVRHQGTIIAIKHHHGIIDVTCQLPKSFHHQAGQFAFLRTSAIEGAHPFTLSCADQGNGQVRLTIKDLGDYTHSLMTNLHVGDTVTVEGPYGCFQYNDQSPQVWVAGGIGITPFMAWLEAMVNNPKIRPEVDFYYCVKAPHEAIDVAHIEALIHQLPNVRFHLHISDEAGFLTMDKIAAHTPQAKAVWFCGPQPFAESLRKDLPKHLPKATFHQERFNFR